MSTIQSLTIENKLERQTKELTVNENRTILDTIEKLTQIEHLYQNLMKFDLEDVFTVHESQIEKLKKSNEEMFKKIRDETVRDKVIKMLDELRNAEAELHKRKVYIEVEYRNTASKVEQLKERINKAMRDFEIAVDNSTKGLQRRLQSNRMELEAIEKEIKFGSHNTLVYGKVKNILLQQKVVLVKGMYSSRQGSSGDAVPQFLNNLNPTAFQKQTNVQVDFTRNVNITNPFEEDDEENPFDDDDFDDVVSEAGSINSKSFKLILQNVVEGGKKSDEEKVQMVLRELTGLDLSDIEVRRLGKPSLGKPRPVLVCFTTLEHVREILKNRKSLLNTKYKDVTVYAYRKKTNANNPNTNNPNANNPNANKPKPKGSRNKGKASPFD